ncbi:type II secretion system protein, partial [bacterium]|nr:type II secretion system protein [bacterium]
HPSAISLSQRERVKHAFTLAEVFSSHFAGHRKTAFTLAEVLITLGIIGIVAALTMPNLIANYQKKQTVTQLKKAYSQLAQALKLSEVTNGEVQYWNLDAPSDEFANKYVLPYLKHSKILPVSEVNSNTKYRFLDGTYASAASGFYGGTAIEIADGTIITVDSWTPSDNSFRTFYIDINGYKKPNVFGKDMFVFWLRSGADLKPYFHQYTREELLFDTSLLQRCTKDKTSFAGMGCATVIMLDGWEIKDDYPW